jgi:hypothetical protein
MITYKDKTDSNNDVIATTVYLEGRVAGIIKKVNSGWRYFPKGHEGGVVLSSLLAVKNSLEAQ